MTTQDSLSRYFVDQGLFPEGSTMDDWLGSRWYRIGGVPVFPIVGKIKHSLILHDVHHVVTGYDTSWKGEFELAGWELGSGGCAGHLVFWFDRLFALALGLIITPLRTLRAARRGLRERNLYRLDSSQVLASDIAEIRRYVAS